MERVVLAISSTVGEQMARLLGNDHMIIGALRVKNEARWIERVLASIAPVCEQILVLDDHSTDGTPELCEAFGVIVLRSEMNGINETRDKNFLLDRIQERASIGDWVLMIDGDEVLFEKDQALIIGQAMGSSVAYSLRILYAWDSENRVRVDGVYGRFARPSMFRITSRVLRFKATCAGGNFHCSSVPGQMLGSARLSAARLLHLGYLHREDRIRKFEFYNRVDAQNVLEDGYRHMVVGDLFPVDSRFRHGGPLRVETL